MNKIRQLAWFLIYYNRGYFMNNLTKLKDFKKNTGLTWTAISGLLNINKRTLEHYVRQRKKPQQKTEKRIEMIDFYFDVEMGLIIPSEKLPLK